MSSGLLMDVAAFDGDTFSDSKANDFMIYGDIDNKNILIGTDIASNSAIKISQNSISFNKETIFNGLTNFLPVGTIMMFAGTAAPYGWLLCDGSLYSNTLYVDLKNALNSLYADSGVTGYFNVPNMQDRFVIGAGIYQTANTASFNLGQNQNIDTSQINIADVSSKLFSHAHVVDSFTTTAGSTSTHTHQKQAFALGSSTYSQGSHLHNVTLTFDVKAQVHTHTIETTSVATTHNHTAPTVTPGQHTHNYALPTAGTVERRSDGQQQTQGIAFDLPPNTTASTNTSYDNIAIRTNTDGSHNHTVNGTVNASTIGSHTHSLQTTTLNSVATNHIHALSGTTNSSSLSHSHILSGTTNPSVSNGSSFEITPLSKIINYIIKY